MQSRYTIAILASHNLVLEGIQRIVEQGEKNAEVVLATKSMNQLQRYCNRNTVDIIILVHFRIEHKVLKQINHLKTRHPDTKVILVNMVHDTHSVNRALQQGLDGYVTRGNISNELNQAISDVVEGTIPYLPDDVASKVKQTKQDVLKKKERLISYLKERKLLSAA